MGLVRLVVFVALAGGLACGPARVPLISTGPLNDLVSDSPGRQGVQRERGPVHSPGRCKDWIEKFEAYWYGPWERTEPAVCREAAFGWAAESFSKKPVFGPNLLRLSAAQVAGRRGQCSAR